jgi:hypothetical protein
MKYDDVEESSDMSSTEWIPCCVWNFDTHYKSGSVCINHSHLRIKASLCAIKSIMPIPPLCFNFSSMPIIYREVI